MGILGNDLPPGLRGYVAGQQANQAQQLAEIQTLGGLIGLQGHLQEQQLMPLKMQMLQAQVGEATTMGDILKRYMAARGGSDPTIGALAAGAAQGDIGPTVTNAARISQPGMLGSNPTQLPPAVEMALLHPRLKELGKVQAEWFKPTDAVREAIQLGYQPGTPQFNAYVGTKFNQGGAWQVSPQGGVNLAPGYAAGMGDVKRSEAQANAGFDFVDVPMPGGGTQKMTRAAAAEMLTRQFTGVPDVNNRPPAERAAIERVAVADRLGQPASVTVPAVPTSRVVAGMGYKPDEASQAAEKETATLRARGGVEREDKFRNSWGDANDIRSKLDLIEHLSADPNVASGALADNVSGLKSIAESFGIRTQGLPAEEVIKAVTTEMSLKIKNQGGTNMMPGAMSDFENKLLQSMGPRLAQSKEGRMMMIQVFKAKAEKDMKIAEMASDYVERHGKLDSGFDMQVRAYSRANPMFTPQRAQAMMELSRRLSGAR